MATPTSMYGFGASSSSAASPPSAPVTSARSAAVNKSQAQAMTSYQPSIASTAAGSLQSALNQIYNLSQQNTARSEAQARELRDWQVQQTQAAQQFNAAEAARNRDWQKMMSDTAHQREVEDLRAAGLNPVLSVMGGQGASTTSGATASQGAPSGSQGQVDMSTTQALVSLLGTLWTSQTEVELQRASAQNNLAIAEKNNASAQRVAEIYGEYGIATQQLASEYGLQMTEVSGAYSKLVSEISSGATVSSAAIHAQATRYAAELNLEGQNKRTFADTLTSLAQTGATIWNNAVTNATSRANAKDTLEQQDKHFRRSDQTTRRGQMYNMLSGGIRNGILAAGFLG